MTAEQKAFIDRVGKAAQDDSTILPSLTLAQAILESGWGKSELAQKANALFGIKADSAWKGPRYEKKTTEHIDGKQVEITAAFRAYGSWEESIADHAALLRGSRYKAVQGERDYKKACRAVHAAGYATAPDYADKLIKLVEQYGLTAWDGAPGVITHTIVKGDTLWSLAVRYLGNGQKWPEIQKLNGGIDPLKLPIGKILKIPGGKSK
ncbi:MAG: glucosaminidase domain-containing protein [Oscillospiraceae bacterium]|nr:glucosaminidase domain-containing protein [Oscillospiraceae bacterium]